ncbi:structural maintenance of chromosomes protein 2 [Hetaerina americana]|uniref:structural maintenance of chromosomes protein 2 n=1 Tax=Hetaerina americana TaxID=62018 RepID=UPI003A7F1446
MHIVSVTLEGFKSYGQRTEIDGFDPLFNAITGLNGTGKSNILDGICFALGITNLSHLRAGLLQDLVYKGGQAGITKASVTLKFNNEDKTQTPCGYHQYAEISITRQVVLEGRNKYMINGATVTYSKVQDLFRSVQLNVNNPHFLIMQGRITKVLNMKPEEILSMIEEATGTMMYKTKREHAQRTIQKKEAKLQEIKALIEEEICPKLDKLKEERGHYLEFQKVQRELEHLTRLYIAWKFVSLEESSSSAETEYVKADENMKSLKNDITSGEEECRKIDDHIKALQAKADEERGGGLQDLEKALKVSEKNEAKRQASLRSLRETAETETKRRMQLEGSVKEDEAALAAKRKELEKLEASFAGLREAVKADREALAAAQRRFQAVSTGLMANDDGEEATLAEQAIAARNSISTAQTEAKTCAMQLKYSEDELKKKAKELSLTAEGYKKDKAKVEGLKKELQKLEEQLNALNYQEGRDEELETSRRRLKTEIQQASEKAEIIESRYALRFNYTDPEPNFDRSRVKGLLCQLVKIKNRAFANALETVAGGRLYNIVVDNEQTGQKLLQRGNLQNRVTFVPLNKIRGSSIPADKLAFAQNLVGADKVWAALPLLEFDPSVTPAIQWAFGNSLICKDTETASKVAFHPRILIRSVTMDGDSMDPGGTVSGGSAPRLDASVLNHLEALREAKEICAVKGAELQQIERESKSIVKVAERYRTLQQQIELKRTELNMLEERLRQTTHHQYQEEVDRLKVTIDELKAKVSACKEQELEGRKKVAELEAKIADSKGTRERELKAAQQAMDKAKAKVEKSDSNWAGKEQDLETLRLETKELTESVESGKTQIATLDEELVKMEADIVKAEEEVNKCSDEVAHIKGEVEKKKDAINATNHEIDAAIGRREKLVKEKGEHELEIQKIKMNMTKLKTQAKESSAKVKELESKYEWIQTDKQFFGQPNTEYDFNNIDTEETRKRIASLTEVKEKLSRNVDSRSMGVLGKVEEQYNHLIRKKKIVLHDKEQIMRVIQDLDDKKKKAVAKAWQQVNKDFSSIFATLLPGAQAKLQPPEGMDAVNGLEVKVGFGGLWKESLTELSGGQRSLVALSLILSMLQFKPAPLYILDEVDAALDLSHTENIGRMLRTHFRNSQFIIVSLKDGMFNNANVLFRTKFVDGVSAVTRTVHRQESDGQVTESTSTITGQNPRAKGRRRPQ